MTVPTAIITVAANRIGAAIVRRFARDGNCVVLIDGLGVGQAVADDIGADRAPFVSVDVAVENDVSKRVETAVKRFGHFDIRVNDARMSLPKAFPASRGASFITGTTLTVDGGVTARLWHA